MRLVPDSVKVVLVGVRGDPGRHEARSEATKACSVQCMRIFAQILMLVVRALGVCTHG